MYGALRQVHKMDAERLSAQTAALQFGTVTNMDVITNRVRVTMQPSGALSGWLPVLLPWSGNGWGELNMPSPNQTVAVFCQDNDIEHGVVLGVYYSAVNLPPTGAVGERVFQHKTGSRISLNNDGTVTITANTQLNITAPITQITGSLQVTGNVTWGYGTGQQADAIGHYHGDVLNGGGVTTAPVPGS
jgi:phage baseplate assembly protein V